MEKPRIFTHLSPDLDAVFASLVAIKYGFGESFSSFFKDLRWRDRIMLVPADYDGSEIKTGDIAVDIVAGGKGIKGEIESDGKVNSATLQILEKFAPIDHQKALEDLIFYLNESDSTGSAVDSIFKDEKGYCKTIEQILKAGSIDGLFRAMQKGIGYKDSKRIFQIFSFAFDGYLMNGINAIKSFEVYKERAKFHGKKKNIVFLDMNDVPMAVCDVAFKEGAEVIIYSNGNDLGIKRKNFSKFPVDHPLIIKVLNEAGEKNEWYTHRSKFFICRGSNKARAKSPSKVRVDRLIHATKEAFELFELKK